MSNDSLPPSKNPYAAPTASSSANYAASQSEHGQPGRGYVRQIPILAIMTIIQGALLSVMGICCVGYGIFIPRLMRMENARMPPDAPSLQFLSIVGICLGALVLIIATMHIIAGIQNLKYRGRIFTIVTWMLGLLASITCYCGPTSIGLAIWGMIVFLNPAVVSAFKMAKSGANQREIENHFY